MSSLIKKNLKHKIKQTFKIPPRGLIEVKWPIIAGPKMGLGGGPCFYSWCLRWPRQSQRLSSLPPSPPLLPPSLPPAPQCKTLQGLRWQNRGVKKYSIDQGKGELSMHQVIVICTFRLVVQYYYFHKFHTPISYRGKKLNYISKYIYKANFLNIGY